MAVECLYDSPQKPGLINGGWKGTMASEGKAWKVKSGHRILRKSNPREVTA